MHKIGDFRNFGRSYRNQSKYAVILHNKWEPSRSGKGNVIYFFCKGALWGVVKSIIL